MAKNHKPNEEEKIVKENIQKRFKNMFSGENEPPATMSIKEVEALRARVAELESQLAGQKAAPSDSKPVESTVKAAARPALSAPDTKTSVSQPNRLDSAALEKRISLWVTGISAFIGLVFFLIALYIVFVLQDGMWELSDKVLMPFTLLMFIASLIGFNFVRRNQTVTGVWISYLINVILGPVLVVLVIQDFHIVMGGYLALFGFLFIALVFPKASRVRALLAALGAALVIAGIEIWNPAFRLSTSHIENFIWMVIGPAAVGILFIFFITYRSRNTGIQARLTVLLLAVIVPLLVAISLLVTTLARARMESGANTELQGTSRGLASIVSTWLELNNSALQELTLQPDINNMNAAEQRPVLQAMAKAHPYMYLVSTTDLSGFNVARNDNGDLTDYSDREWFLGAQQGSPITYQSLIGRTTGQPALVASMPIKNATGKIVGVGMFAADLTSLAEQTQVTTIGDRGYVYIIDARNQTLAHPDPKVTAELRDMSEYPPVVALRQGKTTITFTDENGERWRAYATPLDNGWAVIAQRPEEEILAPARQFQTVTFMLILAAGVIMIALVWFTIRRTLQPIATLTNIISAISAGDLNRVVEVNSQDEIGKLAHTFNAMTLQIRNLIGNLEQRVADRTHDLQLAAEVGQTVTGRIAHVAEMLTEAVEIIRARFDLYYTQVYLTEPSGQRLILRAGTGDIGSLLLQRGHNLIINSGSLNGRAVLEKRAQIVADTSKNPTFLPNPLLPNTRSEMCVPLIVEGNVVGVLDMQSEHPDALSENNLPAFEALAGQLAVAVRNAALFTEVQESRSEVEAQMTRFAEQGWENFLNAIDQEQKIGFAFADSKVARLQPEMLATRSKTDSVNMPIMVTGTKVGEIQLPASLKSNDLELVSAVSEQLAQHVENLRLLAQAETFRKEAEQAVRRLTHEGWESYLSTSSQLNTGYVYDLNQVQPLSESNHPVGDQALKHSLVIRDEPIGELKLDLPESSEVASEILSAVAQQLSGHIENLRLSELNEKHAQREQTLRQITSALRSSTNPATIMRTAVRELGTTLGRKAVIQMVTPEQAAQGTENETDSPANQS